MSDAKKNEIFNLELFQIKKLFLYLHQKTEQKD